MGDFVIFLIFLFSELNESKFQILSSLFLYQKSIKLSESPASIELAQASMDSNFSIERKSELYTQILHFSLFLEPVNF